jgi:hypothetical protein
MDERMRKHPHPSPPPQERERERTSLVSSLSRLRGEGGALVRARRVGAATNSDAVFDFPIRNDNN